MKTLALFVVTSLAAPLLFQLNALADQSKQPERTGRNDQETKDRQLGPAGTFDIVVETNIAYRADLAADPMRHRLDLYLPKGRKNSPVVMFIHGGGWHSGSKDLYAPMGRLLARNGLAAVLINYRLTPEVRHPAHVEDAAKAFAWTKANIGKYGGQADQIILFGHSAGGHLAALLATDERYLKAEGLGLADIRCVAAISGAYALDSIYGLYPSVFGIDRSARRDASPRYHITDRCPPFLILYAEKDLPTVAKESEKFGEALRQAKCEAHVQMLKNRTHISEILLMSRDDDLATQLLFDFIDRQTDWKRPFSPVQK